MAGCPISEWVPAFLYYKENDFMETAIIYRLSEQMDEGEREWIKRRRSIRSQKA